MGEATAGAGARQSFLGGQPEHQYVSFQCSNPLFLRSCVPAPFRLACRYSLVTFRPSVAPAGILVGGSSKGGGGGGGAGGLFGRSDHGGGVGGGGSYADPEHTELEDVGDYSDQMQELRDKNKEIVSFLGGARGPGQAALLTRPRRDGPGHWEQDAALDAIGEGVSKLHAIAVDIGTELDTQNKMIEELNDKVDTVQTHLVSLNSKLKNQLDGVRRRPPSSALSHVLATPPR